MYYKIVDEGIITVIGESKTVSKKVIEISKNEYNRLMLVIETKPVDTLEAVYRLSNETEEYVACERTHSETVDWYVQEIVAENITIDDVPEEYKEEVTAKLPTPEVDRYQEGYDRAVLDCLESGIL